MAWLLIPAHVAALVAWVFATKWEVKRNADLIAADGAKDSLHEGFHWLRSFYRITAALSIAGAASLPLWHHDKAMAASMVGLMAAFSGWFTWKFNPALNLARGKAEYYASVEPRAALFPDRLAVALARKTAEKNGGEMVTYLAAAYQAILVLTLGMGIFAYVGCMAAAVWIIF